MMNLHHPCIIKYYESGEAIYNKPGVEGRTVFYIVTELAEGGELFEIVAQSG